MGKKIFEDDSENDIEIINASASEAEAVAVSEAVAASEAAASEAEAEEAVEPVKKRKKRAPLTEERKAQLLKNLEAGRKKALEVRQKKAQAKKILKKKKDEEMDNLIKEDLMSKKFEKTEKDKLRQDLDEMKNMMKNLMEENKKLKSSKPSVNEELPPQEPKQILPQPIQEAQANKQTVKPPKIHQSKGITSRWSKYNRL